ncbi:MAG: hypothetical protein AABY07_01895 [Nanoarchaeota archaeon]
MVDTDIKIEKSFRKYIIALTIALIMIIILFIWNLLKSGGN